MKILGILPHSIGGRLTISSIFDGFKDLGWEVLIFDELKDEEFPKEEFEYIVGYDFSGLKIKIDRGLNIKSINYFSDEIKNKTSGQEWEKYYPYLKEENNYTFYWDRELAKEEKNVIYQPHFVNCEVYKNLGLKKEYDVMFAGRLDTDYRLETFVRLMKELPALKFAWYAIKKHYEDGLSRVGEKEKVLLKQAYKGFIDNESDMAQAINKTKIVYNINAQGKSSLNYRTFQTTACEKLLISDEREELDLFNGIMPSYKSFEDLKQKILYYTENEIEYIYCTRLLKEITQKNHNSKDCTKKMLGEI